ncbi:MAG TPA: AHH domain-containing protein [Phycisphaerales bacterium]|nr:AHH domain-containing protein [Phycisphaerales bacterium]
MGGLFGNFQINQSDDFDWAFDWSADDYDYSRTRTRPEDFWGDYGFSSATSEGNGETGEGADGPVMCRSTPKRLIPGSNFHHIATNKNWKAGRKWSKQFSLLFQQAGLSMNNKANLIELSKELHNRGRHSQKYHTEVYERLSKAIGNLKGEEAQLALKNELARLSDDIAKGVLKLYD